MDQVRLERTKLNSHIYTIGISTTQGCLCGHKYETTEHFLLNGFLYTFERNVLLSNISGILEKSQTAMSKENLIKTIFCCKMNYDLKKTSRTK